VSGYGGSPTHLTESVYVDVPVNSAVSTAGEVSGPLETAWREVNITPRRTANHSTSFLFIFPLSYSCQPASFFESIFLVIRLTGHDHGARLR